jgi:hypothetical protein
VVRVEQGVESGGGVRWRDLVDRVTSCVHNSSTPPRAVL